MARGSKSVKEMVRTGSVSGYTVGMAGFFEKVWDTNQQLPSSCASRVTHMVP